MSEKPRPDWKGKFLPFKRYRQRTAEQSLKRYPGKNYRDGPETLDVKENNVKRAPLWEDTHGTIDCKE